MIDAKNEKLQPIDGRLPIKVADWFARRAKAPGHTAYSRIHPEAPWSPILDAAEATEDLVPGVLRMFELKLLPHVTLKVPGENLVYINPEVHARLTGSGPA